MRCSNDAVHTPFSFGSGFLKLARHSPLAPLASVLFACCFSPGIPAAIPGVVRLDSIRLANPNAILLQGRVPTNCYAIVEQATGAGAPFQAVTIVVPANPGAVRAALPISAARTGIFRLRAVPLDEPDDVDDDGMDDVYESQRSHVLNPLDPGDALRDADGDGDSNLTEYLSRTESAPPRSDARVDYDSLAELRTSAPVPLPPMIHLGGYAAQGDGWGGWFAWREGDTRPADDALIAAFRNNVQGRLERVIEADDPILTAWWRPASDTIVDSGPVLQKAFDYVSTRPVRKLVISPGRYRISAKIAYSDPDHCPLRLVGVDDFEIEGAGATLWTTYDGEMLMLKDCHRGIIRNLTLQGAGADRSLPDGNYASIALVGTQSDLEFNACRLSGFMHGISHLHGEKTSVRVTVRGCSFSDGGDLGQQTLGSDGAAISGIGDDWLVESNYFDECGRSVEVENTNKESPIRRVVIRSNHLTNVRNLGIMAFLGGPASGALQQSDILVRDNVIIGKSPRHIDPRDHVVPVMSIVVNGGSRWVVQGNICDDGDYAGISLFSNQAPVEDCLVTGNVVTRMGGRGIQIITTQTIPLRGVIVSNNRIRECYDRGLLLAGEHIVAQGNMIENVASGISIGDVGASQLNVLDVIVRGNSLRNITGGLPAILVAPGVQAATVADNDITDAAVGVRDLSGNAGISGNRFFDVPLPFDPESDSKPGSINTPEP